jgi:hypothetical protein
LFGYAGLQRVRLCYVLDEFETSVIWVGIAAHNKGSFLWKIELGDSGAVAAPERLPLGDDDNDTGKLVRLKETAPDEAKKKNEK